MSALDWQSRAACADHTALFDAANDRDYDATQRALAICAGCPVAEQCAAYAKTHGIRDGVWGGQDRGRRKPGPGRPPAKCGTPSGYRRHRRLKEAACGACKEAQSAAKKRKPSREEAA